VDQELEPGRITDVVAERRSARITVEELRTILLTDPEAFEHEVQGLIGSCTDAVTKRFWTDVQEFARHERSAKTKREPRGR